MTIPVVPSRDTNSPIPITQRTIKAIPTIAAAAYQAPITKDDGSYMTQIAGLSAKNKELSALNYDKARREFLRLDPGIQEQLKTLWNNPFYSQEQAQKPGGFNLLGAVESIPRMAWNAVSNFFPTLFKAGEEYTKAIRLVPDVVGGLATGGLQFSDLMRGKTWQEMWDGRSMFDKRGIDELTKSYGHASVYIASKLLAGAKWGEIVDGYGPIDEQFSKAFAEAIDPKSNFQQIIDDVQSTHLDIGRELERSILNVHSSYGLQGFQRRAFSNVAKAYNLVTEIALDPLTYASFGTSAVARLGLEGARVLKAGEALTHIAELSGDDIVRVMNMPGVKDYWDNLGEQVSRLKSAREAGNNLEASQIRQTIARRFPLYDSDEKLRILMDAEVGFDTKGNPIIGIRNHQDAIKYFGSNHPSSIGNFLSILQGRLDNTTFYRDGALISRQTRLANSHLAESVMNKLGFRDVPTNEEFAPIVDELISKGVLPSNKMELVANADRNGFINRITRMFERSPSGEKIYMTDELAHKSVNAVYRYARLILPKGHAKAIAEEFLNGDMAHRFMLMRGVYAGIMQKIGLDHVAGGEEVMQNTLHRLGAEGAHFGVQVAEDIPAQFIDSLGAKTKAELEKSIGGKILLNTGPVQPGQLTDWISGLDTGELKTIWADSRVTSDNKLMHIRHIGGMTEKAIVKKMMNQWSLFTLAPVLGIRSVIDEGFMHFLTLPGNIIRKYVMGEGRKLNEFMAYVRGTDANLGMAKSFILKKLGKGPAEFWAKEAPEVLAKAAELGAGSTKAVRETFEHLWFEHVANVYGKHFNQIQLRDLSSLWRFEPDVLDSIGSAALDILKDAGKRSLTLEHMIAEDNALSKVFKELKIAEGNNFTEQSIQELLDKHGLNHVDATHMHIMLSRLMDRGVQLTNGAGKKVWLDFTDLIAKHNGFETAGDVEAAFNDALGRVGVQSTGDTNILSFCDKALAIDFLSRYSSSGMLLKTINAAALTELGAGAAELTSKFIEGEKAADVVSKADKATLGQLPDDVLINALHDHIAKSFIDSYIAVHGAANQFNPEIVKWFKEKGGVGEDFSKDKLQFALQHDLSFDKFKELVKNHHIQGHVNTALDFDGSTVKGFYQRFQDKTYEAMDRQIKSIIRQPITHILYMDARNKFRNFEKLEAENIANDLFASRIQWRMENLGETEALASKRASNQWPEFRQRAEEIADKKFTHIALDNAMGRTLKYADNPAIKSNLATSIRTVGRFYRATEDFYRRSARLVLDEGPKALYRARLLHHGLVSSGFMYTDQNGEEYIAVPGDNIIFSVVDHTIRSITGQSGMVQPMWNNMTFNVSSLNPSFQQNAGAPTFAGPIAGVSALAVRAMLGLAGDKGLQASDHLDALVLGKFSGNLNFWNAVIPNKLTKAYTMLSGDDKLLQMNSAMIQATCYLAANGQLVGEDGKPIGPQSSARDIAYAQDQIRKTTHNLLTFRQALGLFSPASPTYRETVNIPDYLKRNGVTSLRQEFFDVLSSISKKADATGIDPYEQAFAMFTKKYPGMAIYTLPREQRLTKVALNYTSQMRSWLIDNKGMYDKYGQAALIFAPQTGNLDQGAYSFLEMHGYIKSKEFKDFFNQAITAEQKKQYYDLATEADQKLSQTADYSERQNIINNLTAQRQELLKNNPLLRVQIQPLTGNIGTADEELILSKLKDLVGDSSSNISAGMRQKMSYALYMMDKILPVLQSSDIKAMGDYGSIYRLNTRDKLLEELKSLCMNDPNMKQAYRMVFEPILTFYAKDARRAGGYIY